MKTTWFEEARFGLFVHFGLYSQLARGEWVMNKEELPREELEVLAASFRPDAFDAEQIADLAVQAGMRYLVFTTMHHDGFRMYHSDRTSFCATKTAAGRDFTAEMIAAARRRGLKVGLYHSLNNWYDQPDAVAALESKPDHERFLEHTFARIRELVTRYQPVDVLWYDGWWPFDAEGWQAEKMNEMVREVQPDILFNARNCLPGDFATPEQHVSPPRPWRPWEACVTLSDNWGYHAGDDNWKSAKDVIKMLARCAQERGNLLLNVAPRGDGSLPAEVPRILTAVGDWLRVNGECIFGTETWTLDPYLRGEHRGDWSAHGPYTVRDHCLYLIATSPPSGSFAISGWEASVRAARILGGEDVPFRQDGGVIRFDVGDRLASWQGLPRVLRLECDRPPVLYKTGGMRIPRVPHPRYDPAPADIAW